MGVYHLFRICMGGEGRETSDKAIVKNCGILDLLQEEDAVMADRGFDIEDIVREKEQN